MSAKPYHTVPNCCFLLLPRSAESNGTRRGRHKIKNHSNLILIFSYRNLSTDNLSLHPARAFSRLHELTRTPGAGGVFFIVRMFILLNHMAKVMAYSDSDFSLFFPRTQNVGLRRTVCTVEKHIPNREAKHNTTTGGGFRIVLGDKLVYTITHTLF